MGEILFHRRCNNYLIAISFGRICCSEKYSLKILNLVSEFYDVFAYQIRMDWREWRDFVISGFCFFVAYLKDGLFGKGMITN